MTSSSERPRRERTPRRRRKTTSTATEWGCATTPSDTAGTSPPTSRMSRRRRWSSARPRRWPAAESELSCCHQVATSKPACSDVTPASGSVTRVPATASGGLSSAAHSARAHRTRLGARRRDRPSRLQSAQDESVGGRRRGVYTGQRGGGQGETPASGKGAVLAHRFERPLAAEMDESEQQRYEPRRALTAARILALRQRRGRRRPDSRACSFSSDSAASGRAKRCGRTVPLPRSRSLALRSWSSSLASVSSHPRTLPHRVKRSSLRWSQRRSVFAQRRHGRKEPRSHAAISRKSPPVATIAHGRGSG
jgi:hypothetical protein